MKLQQIAEVVFSSIADRYKISKMEVTVTNDERDPTVSYVTFTDPMTSSQMPMNLFRHVQNLVEYVFAELGFIRPQGGYNNHVKGGFRWQFCTGLAFRESDGVVPESTTEEHLQRFVNMTIYHFCEKVRQEKMVELRSLQDEQNVLIELMQRL